MELQALASKFGKMQINLRSIEFLARAMLDNKKSGVVFPQRIDTYKVGDHLPKTYLTADMCLSNILKKFSKEFSCPLDVDRIVRIRNALSHGRLSAILPDVDIHLFNTKSIKGSSTHVQLTYSAKLDDRWFDTEAKFIFQALLQITILNNKLKKQRLITSR